MAFTPKNCECPHCGATYFKDAPWKRVCLDCYIDVKREENGEPPLDRTQRRSKEPPKQKARPNHGDDFWSRFNQASAPPRGAPSGAIEKEMLRRLIQLCHPDKHNNSEASLKATTWLLTLK